jgi:hypothetical protein
VRVCRRERRPSVHRPVFRRFIRSARPVCRWRGEKNGAQLAAEAPSARRADSGHSAEWSRPSLGVADAAASGRPRHSRIIAGRGDGRANMNKRRRAAYGAAWPTHYAGSSSPNTESLIRRISSSSSSGFWLVKASFWHQITSPDFVVFPQQLLGNWIQELVTQLRCPSLRRKLRDALVGEPQT